MLSEFSRCNVADNSGAKEVMIIKNQDQLLDQPTLVILLL